MTNPAPVPRGTPPIQKNMTPKCTDHDHHTLLSRSGRLALFGGNSLRRHRLVSRGSVTCTSLRGRRSVGSAGTGSSSGTEGTGRRGGIRRGGVHRRGCVGVAGRGIGGGRHAGSLGSALRIVGRRRRRVVGSSSVGLLVRKAHQSPEVESTISHSSRNAGGAPKTFKPTL